MPIAFTWSLVSLYLFLFLLVILTKNDFPCVWGLPRGLQDEIFLLMMNLQFSSIKYMRKTFIFSTKIHVFLFLCFADGPDLCAKNIPELYTRGTLYWKQVVNKGNKVLPTIVEKLDSNKIYSKMCRMASWIVHMYTTSSSKCFVLQILFPTILWIPLVKTRQTPLPVLF